MTTVISNTSDVQNLLDRLENLKTDISDIQDRLRKLETQQQELLELARRANGLIEAYNELVPKLASNPALKMLGMGGALPIG